jgi:hypothetical protein
MLFKNPVGVEPSGFLAEGLSGSYSSDTSNHIQIFPL